MLNFIVLGIIPGTSITLTFSWVLTIGLLSSLVALWYVKRIAKATARAVQMMQKAKTV